MTLPGTPLSLLRVFADQRHLEESIISEKFAYGNRPVLRELPVLFSRRHTFISVSLSCSFYGDR